MDNSARKIKFATRQRSRESWILSPSILAATILAAMLMAIPVSMVIAASVEAKVRSAYLYNLLRRTTWPDNTFANDESPYRVVVLGEDRLEGLLEKIAQIKKVNKRGIELEKINSLDQLRPCHMLYVPGYLDTEQQQAVLKKVGKMPCLVVGDSPGFARAGASANFVDREDGTVGLELNLAQAKAHNLKFDQQLVDVSQVLSE